MATAETGTDRTDFDKQQNEDLWLGALWGKSAEHGGGTINLLLSHMLDTAEVARIIWDKYLAESVRQNISVIAGGQDQGMRFFMWLCGIHDLGKATPLFQHIDRAGAGRVWDAGLTWDRLAVQRFRVRHEVAGAVLARGLLADAGWTPEQCGWVWPLVAGHHGTIMTLGEIQKSFRRKESKLLGTGDWPAAQRALLARFTSILGIGSLGEIAPQRMPSRAVQLQLSGFIVMADWIASNDKHFGGIDTLAGVTSAEARKRASKAWDTLGLRRGWGRLTAPGPGEFRARFGDSPRQSQLLAVKCAEQMSNPGLIILEAPMGEGKTKAALLVAEALAARFGLDGVFLGMPTQSTSDPMFSTVRAWLAKLDPALAGQVALLHGKRSFNKEWQKLLSGNAEADDCYSSVGEDEYGEPDPYSSEECDPCLSARPERTAPAEWFLGNKRGLLAPFVVGTIDQLLIAATRTKHVMLRMAGLAGKVVILDEVHAADIYMSQFLVEGLRWLGQAGIPVVLLSATLAPQHRSELVRAYLAGARSTEKLDTVKVPAAQGYPRVTTACISAAGQPTIACESARPWRSNPVRVGVHAVSDEMPISDILTGRVSEGGCVLVIRNTVGRAQDTFNELRADFGDCVRLLHGRMHVRHRAERTEDCLRVLGHQSGKRRESVILVATQLAEQSFDIDADMLITDLTTLDLLLQRIGRLHRHDGTWRPESMRRPLAVVTGFTPRGDQVPELLAASEDIYGQYPLLRSAAMVLAAQECGWELPGHIADLVATAYDTGAKVPQAWQETVSHALKRWQHDQQRRADSAAEYLLTRLGEHGRSTLAGLHRGEVADLADLQARVRDGADSVEVVLVRHDGRGYRTENQRWLGSHGEASPELVDDVLGGTVRLPAGLTGQAKALRPLPGWRDHPWLRYSRALTLDADSDGMVGTQRVRYDDELGLLLV